MRSDLDAVRVRITGRVQGVWFRGWTVAEARSRGLRGWVRNCQDGSVEALFIGPSDALEDLVERCHQGPTTARVAQVKTFAAEDDGSLEFRQVKTV